MQRRLSNNSDIGQFAQPPEFEEGPLDHPPSKITVAWVGRGPEPAYHGHSVINGRTVHYLEVIPGIMEVGTLDELQNRIGFAGLALAQGHQDYLREQAEEGHRHASLLREDLA